MKKIINRIFILVAAVVLFSCTPEENDIFGDSASNRIEAAMKADQAILTGAKNGWLMQFYPSAQQTYGGYNVLALFTADKVKVASELTSPSGTAESLYSLKQSAGPVLTFDVYNDIFHIFSTPEERDAPTGNNGVGMAGDFEFLILKATPDSVILKGRKTGNKIVMTPMKEGIVWTDYITQLNDAEEEMTFRQFEYQIGDKKIPVSVSFRSLSFTYTDGDENAITVKAPYIQTPTGYKLYKPLTIFDVTVEEFTFAKEGELEYFKPTNGASAKLVVVYPPVNRQLVSGNWYFKYSGVGTFGRPYWNYTKVNGLDRIGERLYWAYIGTHSDGKYAFSFASYDGTGLYGGALHFNYQLIGEDKVKYTFAGTGAGDGVWYHNNAAFNYIINPIGTSAGRTFTVTTDNLKSPTWIKLTEDGNPNNTFELMPSVIIWPYDK